MNFITRAASPASVFARSHGHQPVWSCVSYEWQHDVVNRPLPSLQREGAALHVPTPNNTREPCTYARASPVYYFSTCNFRRMLFLCRSRSRLRPVVTPLIKIYVNS